MKNISLIWKVLIVFIIVVVIGELIHSFYPPLIDNSRFYKTSSILRTSSITSKGIETSLPCMNLRKIPSYYKRVLGILGINGLKLLDNDTIVVGINIHSSHVVFTNYSYIGSCVFRYNNATIILLTIINETGGIRIIIHGMPNNNKYLFFIKPFLFGKPYRYSYLLKIRDFKKLLMSRDIGVKWVIWHIGIDDIHRSIVFNDTRYFVQDIDIVIEIPSFYIRIGNRIEFLEGLEEVSWRLIGYPVFSLLSRIMSLKYMVEELELYKEIIRYMIYYSSPLKAYTSNDLQTPNTLKIFYNRVSGNCLSYSIASIVLGVSAFDRLIGLAINHELKHAYSLIIYPSRIYGFIGKIKLLYDIDEDNVTDTADILIDTGFYNPKLLNKIDELYVFTPRSIGIIVSTINEILYTNRSFIYPSYDLMNMDKLDSFWRQENMHAFHYYPAYVYPSNSSKHVIVSDNPVNSWYRYLNPNYRWGMSSKCIDALNRECIAKTDYDIGPLITPRMWLEIIDKTLRDRELIVSPSLEIIRRIYPDLLNYTKAHCVDDAIIGEIEKEYVFVRNNSTVSIKDIGYLFVSSNLTVICQGTCYGDFKILFKSIETGKRLEPRSLYMIVYAGSYKFLPKYFYSETNDSLIIFFSMRDFSLKDPIFIYVDNLRMLIKPLIKRV